MATAMEIPRTKPKPNKNRCVYRWMFFEHHVDKHNVDRWRRSQTMSMRQNNYSEAFCVFQTKIILSLVHGVCAFDLASWSERILRAAPVCHRPGALRLILAQAKRMLFYFIFFSISFVFTLEWVASLSLFFSSRLLRFVLPFATWFSLYIVFLCVFVRKK